MTSPPANGLDLVLSFSGELESVARVDLDQLRREGRTQDERIDALERRLCGGTPAIRNGDATASTEMDPIGITPAGWDALVREAASHFAERGVDPATVDVESLLDPKEVAQLRWATDLRGEFACQLDLIDVAIAVFAGIAATVVDVALVKIPKDLRFNGISQAGSPVTAWLRQHNYPSDNWLAKLVKVPYDAMTTSTVGERLDPRTHRSATFGHDPLLGLVFGTIDILRGTSTGVDNAGRFFVHQAGAPAASNALIALVLQIGHLLSDVGTNAGVPAPGWSALRTMNFGDIDGQSISKLSRQMYLRGYDSRHFLTMSTSVAAAELVLRGGWALRSCFDPDWEQLVTNEERLVGSDSTGQHPRFVTMALVAHGVAALGNAGKIAVLGGNPLAFNYAQWLRFGQVLGSWWKSAALRPDDILAIRSDMNLAQLMDGWPVEI